LVWIDAQLPVSLAGSLQRTFAVAAKHVFELGLVQAKDEGIYRAAAKAGAIIATKDSDFVRLQERFGPPPRILWITMGNVGNAELWKALEAQWPRICAHFEAGEPLVEIGRTG
jgi:predicted nuclease of predicted toxin-antitoxin system